MTLDVSRLLNCVADLQGLKNTLQSRETTAVSLAGAAYKTDVQKIIAYDTGTLRRSVHVTPSEDGFRPVALVGTNVPYARRVEFGFYAVDKLGRHYSQTPRPAWRPAFDNNREKYRQIIANYLLRATKNIETAGV